MKKKIFENYEKIWKVTSLIAFVGMILNLIFLKFDWLIIAICITHLVIIIPSGIIAKREDNKLGETVRRIAMAKEGSALTFCGSPMNEKNKTAISESCSINAENDC